MIRLLRGLGTGIAVIGLLLGSTAPPAQAAYTRSCASHLHALPAVGPVAGTSVQAYFFYQDYWLRGDYCQIGKAKIILQYDGNLVVYDEVGRARWAASWSRPGVMGAGFQAFMQEDSDFVLYTGQGPGPGNSVWSSKTGKYQQSYTFLAVQSDGNVVIYQDGVVLWESHSNH